MKSKIIIFNKKKKIKILIIFFTIITGVIGACFCNSKIVEKDIYKEEKNNTIDYSNIININRFKKSISNEKIEIEEYNNMPSEIKGYKVIGKLAIPSIELNTYILNETNEKTLNVSVTKIAGPKINKVGNFCITGHNYLKDNMFGKLKKVNLNDNIVLTDTFGREQEYVVYDKFEISPDDVSILNQNTNNKKEVTLITCTIGALKRLVVKAIEI